MSVTDPLPPQSSDEPPAARLHADDLIDYVAASPSSFHAAQEGARRLRAAGFVEQDEAEPWDASEGGHFLVRDGALMAWWVPAGAGPRSRFRVVGSHTDSPTFKLKPDPLLNQQGYSQVGVEVYGGPLLNSWLDRELGVAGRIVTTDGTVHTVRTGPIMRIPQLAIHLDRGVNDNGVRLDKQQHTAPLLDLVAGTSVLDLIGEQAGIRPRDVAGHDLVAYTTERGGYFGDFGQFVACARLDNLSSVHASLTALLELAGSGGESADVAVLAAFDHEEIGSGSRSGAAGPVLEDVLRRTALALGATPDQTIAMVSGSTCVSADAGHAMHPNYPGHHDPVNRPILGGGPLLKINANQRYSTDAVGSALWRRACTEAGIRTQAFVSNNAIPCGSTIGPLTATRLGMTVVDVGTPLLSMHSAREMCATDDLLALTLALTSYWRTA
ncbi:M18 family aminopeptidase [Auraticoccus sp. F435]|uniref:M18 family aminopeptidase n=1 Tax=Auraticoccus cholistanensis TaxID=2656650 RepID=A0A6A9UXJ2_9ACTN|nr:M18 family aminopeptidase [Auraticoccus cholistanensis]MVA76284.1 M18 family aminopeptidase [Auraticoccus cholistanensis]